MRFVKYIAKHVYRFLLFFLLTAFIVTCSLLLFLRSVDIEVELLRQNATATFINVVFLSLLFCIINEVRIYLTDTRAVDRIETSLQKITAGDFSEKIEPLSVPFDNRFNLIIADINRMTEELAGVETLRSDFIANVSHELKTPLAVMQNYARMLKSPALSEEERLQYAEAISSAAKRLSDLISNILRLNKLENQQIYPNAETYDLSEQLCACLLQFEPVLDEKALDVENDIADGVYITADAELLSLVWNNLFSNAVKFTPPGGKITVRLHEKGGICVVTVADTGCGISREVGAHIFEKFYQGDTSHAEQGNGLGLALVKRVVEIVGGEIEVESEVGKGTAFTVRLGSKRRAEI